MILRRVTEGIAPLTLIRNCGRISSVQPMGRLSLRETPMCTNEIAHGLMRRGRGEGRVYIAALMMRPGISGNPTPILLHLLT
eukprot:6273056-Pyramimonas_sp.AAC.1